MEVVLFAIIGATIGATIEAGAGYWICFSVYCVIKVFCSVIKALKDE